MSHKHHSHGAGDAAQRTRIKKPGSDFNSHCPVLVNSERAYCAALITESGTGISTYGL
jgi:hypothetical protein